MNTSVPPDDVALRTTVCPWSSVEVSGATETVGVESTFTVTESDVAVTGAGVADEDTPVSVSVTLNTQLLVVPVGMYVNEAALPGLLKPGHVPVFVHA